jgi:hypothetical protein
LAANRGAFGALLETFILSEVLKLASWTGQRFSLSHYRDKEQNEVDIVSEDEERRTVGLEVKAGATVTPADFNGLRKLAEASPWAWRSTTDTRWCLLGRATLPLPSRRFGAESSGEHSA